MIISESITLTRIENRIKNNIGFENILYSIDTRLIKSTITELILIFNQQQHFSNFHYNLII